MIGVLFDNSYWWLHFGPVSKDRCDALENLQNVDFDVLKQTTLAKALRLCNRGIGSYQTCTGYAKHWKHFKRMVLDRLDPDTWVFVDHEHFLMPNAAAFLHASGQLSKRQWRVLNGADDYTTRYELLRMDSLKRDIRMTRNEENTIILGLKDAKVQAKYLLKYANFNW